jgi:hypothetical protein
MSKRVKLAFAMAASAATGAALVMSACESVPLTAAPGTLITVDANPRFVIANGGVSVVTAILVEPAGTFVPDGTEVFFFTNLGRVDASGKSRDGVVRVNFVSDSRSGTATVTAISGGPAPAPTGSPAPTPTPGGGSPDVTARADTMPGAVAAVTRIEADENSDSVEIAVGNALPERVLVSAAPQVLAAARSATIVANVLDGVGNPVQNVPVFFAVTAWDPDTAPKLEQMQSGGSPRYTDANGQAFDVLTTRAPFSQTANLQKTVTVTATTATGENGTVEVVVNYAASR